MRIATLYVVCALGCVASLAGTNFGAAADEKPVTYDDQIAAILKKRCATCHGDGKQESGLSVTSYAGVMKGGSGGKIVIAGRSGASRLVEVVTAVDDNERMPPDGERLTADQVAVIRKWIDGGLRENSGSSVAATRTLGFTPSGAIAADAPGAVPSNLATFNRPATKRKFPMLGLATSPRASVAALSSYGAVDLIDPATLKPLGAIAFPEGEPLVLNFSRSGRLLLAAGGKPVQNGAVVLFDVATGKRLASVADEPDAIIAADISPDERFIAIGCTSRLVKIFSTQDGSLRTTIDKHTDWVTAVAYSPNGKHLATGDRVGNVHLWDGVTGGAILPLSEHKKSVRALAWRSDGAVVASCGEDGTIVWWDAKDGWPLATKTSAHGGGVFDIRFGPRGELVSSGRDGMVKLWSTEGNELRSFSIIADTPAELRPAAGIKLLATRVALTADGQFILAGDSAGRLHRWESSGTKASGK